MTRISETTTLSGNEPIVNEPLVFIGSGPVAARSLALLAQDFSFEAIITKPRPPHHKGPVPVLELAHQLDLPIIEVNSKQELSEKIKSAGLASRLAVLIDFGIIVAQDVIDVFPLGIVNSHFSLLPQWRGADPITFSILSGQDQTGVSLMLLVEAMDEGPLLAVGEYDLPADITTPKLTEDLIQLSYALLLDVLPRYMAGEVRGRPQEEVAKIIGYSPEPTYSTKISKQDGAIDWKKSAEQIERQIRAYLGWPGSRTKLGEIEVTITQASLEPSQGESGQIDVKGNQLIIRCQKNSLSIERLKPAGKKEMTAEEFLRGYRSRIGKKAA